MIKKIKYILFMILIFTLVLSIKSFARITTNDPTVNSGETVKITINSQEGVASGAINITSNSGLTFESVTGGTANGTRVAFAMSDNKTNGIATYTFKAPNVTENKTYTVVFSSEDMADKDGNPISSSTATATVTVKAAQTDTTPTPEPTPEPTPTPEPEQPTAPTVTEPTFTKANKTMYATGDINLRASWSTDSAATKIEKGTELTVIGTSNEKVNGYVWYRVSYQGKTRYVASNLLTSEKPEENEEEKANANLKSLTVEGFSLSPSFSADVLEYSMQVEMETEKLNITAEAENEKATVKIEGNETLAEGENIVKIIVTAEDGTTTKTYTIKVTKEENIFGLKSLNIKDTDISSSFKTDVYDYEVYIKNIDMLDIEAIATEEDATVEILGNENLQEGENIITIIVKSKDETKTITYQIKATKLVVTEQTEQKTIDTKYIIYGVIGGILLIALVGVVIYTIKNRKEEMYMENGTDDFEYYPEDLPEKQDYEYYPEDLPEKVEKNNYFEEDNYSEEEYENVEEDTEKDTESYKEDKSNYFLDDPEDWNDDQPKRRRGKHF